MNSQYKISVLRNARWQPVQNGESSYVEQCKEAARITAVNNEGYAVRVTSSNDAQAVIYYVCENNVLKYCYFFDDNPAWQEW